MNSSLDSNGRGRDDRVRVESWPHRLRHKAVVGRDLLRIHGPGGSVRRILPWLACRRYLVFEGSLSTRIPDFRAEIPIRVGPAAAADLSHIFRLRPGFYDPDVPFRRNRQGQVCFMAWEGDRPIHARWIFRGSVYLPYIDRILTLPPDEVYWDEVYTIPGRRRMGVDYQTLRTMIAWFAGQGYKRHAFFSPTWDAPLHRRAAAFGMTSTGSIRCPSLWDRRLKAEGAARDLGHGLITLGKADGK